MSLANKVVLITGAGTGMGANAARAFHKAGSFLVLNGRRPAPLERTAVEVDPSGERVAIVSGDIGNPATSRRMVEVALKRFGGVDVLFNNAGIFAPKPFLETTPEELDTYLNLKSTGDLTAMIDNDDDPNTSLSSAEAQASVDSRGFVNGADSGPSKSLTMSASAHAGIATLGVSLNGTIAVGEGDEFQPLGGEIKGAASASWKDTMTIFDGSHEPGTTLVVTTRMTIDGHMFTTATSLPSRKQCLGCPSLHPAIGVAEVALFFEDFSTSTFGFGDDDGVLKIGESLSGVETNTELPPESIDVKHLVVNGEPYTIGFGLRLGGEARASFTVLAVINADYSRTLNWGGITSVVDMATGEEVQGWTVSSASGFDYSRPIEVPEPTSLLSLGTVACAQFVRRRRMR